MNSDSIKAKIRNLSMETGIEVQELLQMFFLERLLERVSKSEFKENFILKGGLLVASMIGISSRSTRDVDATIITYPVNEHDIDKMLKSIITTDLKDGVEFEVQSIFETREDDEYSGYKVMVKSHIDRVWQYIKIDITTGDEITPGEIEYIYKSQFGFDDIEVYSYNLETLLAEKLETVLSRGAANTRMRDFYDIYVLLKMQGAEINIDTIKSALKATAKHRNSVEAIENAELILEVISDDNGLKDLWRNYQKKYAYAVEIDYNEVLKAIEELCKLAK